MSSSVEEIKANLALLDVHTAQQLSTIKLQTISTMSLLNTFEVDQFVNVLNKSTLKIRTNYDSQVKKIMNPT